MTDWLEHKLLLIILTLTTIGAVTITVFYFQLDDTVQRHKQAIVQNQTTITHLCTLTHTIRGVWQTAVDLYDALPTPTVFEQRRREALAEGVRQIDLDTTCVKGEVKP